MPHPTQAFDCGTTVQNDDPIVRDHRVHGVRIMPGVVFLDLVFRALHAKGFDTAAVELRDILFVEPIATTEQFGRKVRLRFKPHDVQGLRWQVVAESWPLWAGGDPESDATENFRCELFVGGAPLEGRLEVKALQHRATRTADADDAYAYARGVAIEHFEFMKGQGRLYFGEDNVLAAFHLGALASEYVEDFLLHPAHLDSSTLVPFLYLLEQRPDVARQPFIPIHIESFRASRPLGERVFVQVSRSSTALVSDDLFLSDIDFYSPEGERIASMRKLSTKRIRSESLISRLRQPEAGERTPEPRPPPASAPAPEGGSGLLGYLCHLLASELGVEPGKIDPEENFYSQGLASTNLLHVVQRLERELDCKLYPTLLFEHSTPAELVAYLEEHHAQAVRRLAPPPEASPMAAPSREVPRPSPASAPAPTAEPIAIIGLAGRYPMAEDLDTFWDNLQAGRDCITEIPEARWDHGRWFDPTPGREGKSSSKWGGFLDGIDQFEPRVFNLSPREAELMDPQERLMLETAWQTLEDAGYGGRALKGRRVGVFVGVMWGQYALLGVEETLKGNPMVPMSFASSLSNRLSYFFDFHGPSLSLDTMCSSSLTALHLACESLRRGECEQALVGGVNLMLHPSKYLFLSENRMLATDGRCRAFGEGGTGYVPGEGVGAVLLKPLSRAEADGDHIHGVIRATAVNHGGRANGYTVPDPEAHHALISEALDRVGVEPGTLGYIEAHGTGTSLGDPIELTGLSKAFSGRVPRGWTCALGSVKSNIGHLEAAAGIAGLTKVLLQLRHRKLAPSLHARQLNPYIDFSATPFHVQRELADWPEPRSSDGRPAPRRAGLSSFGAGGSNAHVILEEHLTSRQVAPAEERPRLIVLSARKEERLRPYAERLLHFLKRQADPRYAGPRTELARLAYTLQIRNDAMDARLAVIAPSLDVLRAQLERYLQGQAEPGSVFQGLARSEKPTKVPTRGVDAAALRELAAQWSQGAEIDWRTLYPEGTPRRTPLPTYPFARQSYWLPRSKQSVPATSSARVHPLLGRNSSTLEAVRFTTSFSAGEPLLADHRIGGRLMLPGVVCLEMALASARLAGASAIQAVHELTWVSPVVAPADGGAVEVSLELRPQGEHLQFQLTSADGTLHARGRLLRGEPSRESAPRASPEAIRSRCARVLSAEACYQHLAARGLEYGESLRPLRALHTGRDEALAELRLPATGLSSENLTLPPSLIDGALQAVVGLLADVPAGSPEAERTWVPFSLGALHLHQPLPTECLAHVTRKARRDDVETFDIQLLGLDGALLVRLEGFAIRALPGPPKPGSTTRIFSETWVPQALTAPATPLAGPVLLFDRDTALRDALRARSGVPALLVQPGTGFRALGDGVYEIAPGRAEDLERLLQTLRQEGKVPVAALHCWPRPPSPGSGEESLDAQLAQGLYTLLHFTREWLKARPVPRLSVLCVWPGNDASQPLHAALSGFCKTVNREHRSLHYRAVSLQDDAVCAPEIAAGLLLAELSQPGGEDDPIRHHRTGRERLRRHHLSLPEANPTSVLRERGVYLITGGRGGLGYLFAEHLARRFQARLVLAGRSEEDAEMRARLQSLATHGAEALYLRADISRRDEAERLVTHVLGRFGALHGVIHSAGVLRDAMIASKRVEDVAQVLQPKVSGAIQLDLATSLLRLDFFVLFSSLAGLIGNVGQCDYSFANRFLDAFARSRAEQVRQGRRSGRSLSIAWPLWREGGMHVDAQTEQHLLRTLGMTPLRTGTGLDFFTRALQATEPVLAVVEGEAATIDQAFALMEAPVGSGTGRPLTDIVVATVSELLSVSPSDVDLAASLEELGLEPTRVSLLSARLSERLGLELKPSHLTEYASLRGLCEALSGATTSSPSVAPAPAAPPPAAPTSTAPLRTWVERRVVELAASILKMDVADVEPTTDLREFGFDSISLVRLASALQEAFGVDITAAMLFEHDSLSSLTDQLLASHAQALAARRPAEAAPAPAPASVPATREPQPEPRSLEVHAPRAASPEPIAIIGMSGTLPRSANLDAFWRHLEQGHDLIEEIPPSRWDWRAVHGDPLGEPNRTQVKWGSFIDGVENFDASFFRITPREAALMDPQHRLFLQTAWHALEDAGYRPSSLAGSKTGVFVGIGTTDYHDLLRDFGLPADAHSATGRAHSVLPNRLSFLLDLHGPSLPVETACSSSLVALHQAVRALREAQCELALVGGVNLLLSPHLYFAFSRAGMLCEDGRCKTFDARANGYVRGEGVGALLLKPLSRAQADGDTIHAVIRGTAINHGGRANALTAPNPNAQAELLVAAYQDAGIDPSTVGYIEAHGTGTSLGDPIEVIGLSKAFSQLYQQWGLPAPTRPHCALGSVKTNIGHLETAAGIAGVLKVLLALRHRTLPASLHFETPNPQLRLEGTPFHVNARTSPWPAPRDSQGLEAPRRAGVSSFGFGGTNAHVVLEEYREVPRADTSAGRAHLVVLSARELETLRTSAARLREALRGPTRPHLEDLAYTLTVGREHLEVRLATVVRDLDTLEARLGDWLARGSAEGLHSGTASSTPARGSLTEDLETLARQWVTGVNVDLSRLYQGRHPRRVSLPGHPFAPTRHWLLPAPAEQVFTSRSTARTALAPAQPTAVPRASPAPRDVPTGELQAATLRYLTQALSTTAGLAPESIVPTADFESYGMNSILIAELNHQLEARFGKLPITLFFKYKNLADLASYLLEEHGGSVQRLLDVQAPRVEVRETAREEPRRSPRSSASGSMEIAVIGMSGRYPQAANLEQYWRNLEAARDCIVEIPSARWDYRPLFEPTRRGPGTVYSKWGGFLDDMDRFDAAFFQISPLIARYMDPQERLFLETAWACLEDAGHTRLSLARADAGDKRAPVGVFVGVTYNEYALFGAQEWARGNRIAFNTQTFSIANRVSYALNLSGPSLTVDTACSSSLNAVHLACESLRSGACELAIAGGVNLSLHPSKYVMLCANRFASSDGRCRSFAEGGDGYVPGEGVGAVLLKPLAQALRDGDAIHAVIKGSAHNHDGKTHGYTVPNPVAQTEVILTALERAGVDARSISYVEAHGTGTSLGDPIELTGLTDAFRRHTKDRGFCAIGSAKASIGHLESAAGIAQLHKVLLQMRHRRLAPTLIHGGKLNPHIDFASTPFQVQREAAPWSARPGEPLRAGISSFGAGGVNVHLLLESWEGEHPPTPPTAERSVIVLSARTPERLRVQARRFLDFLETRQEWGSAELASLAFTLQEGREAMAARLAFVAGDLATCRERLRTWLAQEGDSPAPRAQGLFSGTLTEPRPASVESSESTLRTLVREGAYEAIARAWVEGTAWPWRALYPERPPRRIQLPTYPFAGERFWIETTPTPPPSPGVVPSAPDSVKEQGPARTMRERLAEAPQAERHTLLVHLLGEQLGQLLAFPPSMKPEPDQGFFEMGMESVQATQFVEQLEDECGLELYPTLTFDYPTLRALATFLLERLPTQALEEAPAPALSETQGELVLARQAWREANAPKHSGALRGLLLLGGEEAHARALRELLSSRGLDATVRQARLGERFVESASGPEFDPADARQVEQLLTWLSRDGFQPSHVFHLGALGPTESGEPTRGLSQMMGLARGFLACKSEGTARLGYVYPLAGGLHPPRHAAVAGFARSLGLETPRLSCQTLALDAQAREPAALASLLLAESASTDIDVRYVAGRRQVHELVELAPETAKPSLLRQGGAYLITGGAGGLGLLLAEHLARTTQARIALAGRGELDAVREQRLEQLRAAGAEVLYLRGDVSDRDAAFRVVAAAREHLGTLNGIIHAAGVTRDTLVVAKVWEQMAEVLGPKVQGTLYLDEASRDVPLDFFALFSSTAAITGNVGQSDYAFANAFLDAFAAEREARRTRGERHGLTVSFNWPLWVEGGMRVDAQTLRFMERRAGLTPLPTSLGLATWEQGLAQGGSQRVVFHGARDKVIQRLGISTGPFEEAPALRAPEPAAPAPRVTVASSSTSTVREPIAIIGMACRFPGGCDSPEALWRFLVEGGDAITEVPPERWDMGAFYDANPEAAGTVYVRQAGFLRETPALFDARFFGISQREAAEMDPQQRLLLEVSWEALERAGLPPDGLAGSPVGVFVGMSGAEYGLLPRSARQFGAYTATGVASNIASGRIAHRLGLQGPALTVDTACSSSLMAVHLACDSLLRGESNVALAGGVNLMLSPYIFVSLCRLRALAPDGRCKTFDASGDGYGRAEGCGMVVLKRLSDAQRDGDPVLAVVLGSAANHDGASSGLTVPNGLAQQALLRKAMESARVEPGQISYVEAHGTGTSLGDPIEMQALGAVCGQRQESDGEFMVGALKANLGHMEAAAGVAGLIKTVLCLRHQAIPGQLHLRQLNPRIRLERMRAHIPRERTPWNVERRLAGVSAFGFSGTNVHVIVGEPPAASARRRTSVPEPTPQPPRPVHLLPLSARNEEALRALARSWREHLGRETTDALSGLCAAALAERSHLEHRAALVGTERSTLLEGLETLAEGRAHTSVVRGTVANGAPRLALALPHEDALSSLKEALYLAEPVFTAAHDASAAAAAELLGVDTREVRGPAAAFCARYALLTLLEHWGFAPDALLADGLGLYAAAHLAGVLRLRDALRCVLRDSGASGSVTLESGQPAPARIRLLRAGAPLAARAAATWDAPQTPTGDWSAALRGLDARERWVVVMLGDTFPTGAHEAGLPWLPVTSRHGAWEALSRCVAGLYTLGLTPDRRRFTEGAARPSQPLPTYPFQRKAYWLRAPEESGAAPSEVFDGTPLSSPRHVREFSYRFSHARLPDLGDNHGIAHIGHHQELLARAAHQHLGLKSYALRDVRYLVPLHVTRGEEREVRLLVEPREGGTSALSLHGLDPKRGQWTLHVQASLEHEEPSQAGQQQLPRLEGGLVWDGETFYRRLAALTFQLGESVKWVEEVRFRGNEALARFRMDPDASGERAGLGFHPGILDACAQLFAVAGAAWLEERMRFMVVGWERFLFYRAPSEGTLHCHIAFPEPPDASGRVTGSFRLFDGKGHLVAEARGHRVQRLSAEHVKALESALHESPPAATPVPPAATGAGREPTASRAQVVDFLAARVAHHLEMERGSVPLGVPLRDLGFDSITGLSLRKDIAERLSVNVPAELLLEGPSIEQLATSLLRELAPDGAPEAPERTPSATPPTSWFAHVVRRAKPTFRLFCLPYGGGGASLYLGWERLPENVEVWPLQLPGREGRILETPVHELEPLLAQLESALTPLLDVPYALYGHSLGGLLAYLTASRLRARGLPQPQHLLVGGFSAPFLAPGPYLESVRRRFVHAGLGGIPRPSELEPLGPLLDILMSTEEGRTLAGQGNDFARALLPMMLADLKLMEGFRYQPEPPFSFPITVFHGAADDRVTEEGSEAWRALTAGAFQKHVTPAGHFFLRADQARDWLLRGIAAALTSSTPTAPRMP
ncbi:SDR family NAD(P)-dependent oxidoreductase [Archangium sp.]|uniref:SDR family NAD(P)-dependent oxidoreductase n=1 Tax=Archangium sp. TaxID=1872627 RepID=UPI00286ABCB3|nr:SDR family NAD(P)-dependent oxidoreductase [Archangium sp.]